MDLAGIREKLAQSQAVVDGKLLAQDAELQQLQQGLTDLEAQASRGAKTVSQNVKMEAPSPPNGNPEKPKGAGGRGRSP